MRFKAPPHTSDATLSIGTLPVVDGFLELPADTPITDIGGLYANGFTLAPDASAPPASAAPTPPPAAPAPAANSASDKA